MTDHLPASHPEVKKPKIGVLLANLGTPDNYDYRSMRRYLSEFLSDKRVVDLPNWKWQPILQLIILSFRPFTSGKAYESIWNHEAGESPLLTITKEQTLAMSDAMEKRYGSEVVVDFCMRYGNPSVESVVQKLLDQGCQKILFVPLYPQYAGATSATANDQLFRALMKVKWQPAVRTITPYFDQPAYIDALAKSVETAYGKLEKRPDILLCSYHGVPKRYLLEGDPYHCHCQKTTRLLMERLGWDETEIKTTFQSIFGREEWLKPYTVEEVKRLAEEEGKTNIAVIAPAFSADCIETLEEINEEIRESFEEGGGKEFTYIPCLNDNPDHIEALAAVVDQNLAGWI
ncbi:Ferrochelatase [Rhodobacteraceae bacterium HTCC2150]|nr:Ferrochelatase [Rhodobacteraceae bacterium HTCC2150]